MEQKRFLLGVIIAVCISAAIYAASWHLAGLPGEVNIPLGILIGPCPYAGGILWGIYFFLIFLAKRKGRAIACVILFHILSLIFVFTLANLPISSLQIFAVLNAVGTSAIALLAWSIYVRYRRSESRDSVEQEGKPPV